MRRSSAKARAGVTHQDNRAEGWEAVPFGASIRRTNARTTKVQRANYRQSGQYPIIDQGQGFIAGYWDRQDDIYPGELPVIVFGDHTRVFKFVDFPFVVGADGTQLLVPDTTRFDPYFLYLAYSSLNIPSRGYNRHFSLLKEQTIVMPPLGEQRAIARVLRTVQEAKEACERVIAATRQLKESLLHHLFTYGPTPFDGTARVSLRETEIGPIPAHWGLSRFGEAVEIASGQVDPREKPYSDMFHVGPEHIEAGSGRLRPLSTAADAGLISGKYLFTDQDVLYSKIRPYLRKAALPTFTGICSADMYPLRPKRGLGREFLFFWLLSDMFTRAIVPSQGRTGIPKVNREQINATPLPVPPETEQKQIASELSAVDAKLRAEETRHGALVSLFASVLDSLMSGRVRLPEFVRGS